MRDICYLVLSQYGVERVNKKHKPALKSGEVAVRLVVTVPDSVFANPFATVRVEVPAEHVVQAEAVSAPT